MKNVLIAGVDEVGRGSLAGPVFAATVVLDPAYPIAGLTDSKKISKHQRELLSTIILEKALAWALGRAEHNEIDELNILQASLLAMQRSVNALSVNPDIVLVDGLYCPNVMYKSLAVVKGDSKIAAISAASIVAKVARDNEMVALDSQYPGYYLAQNKGYPTKQHINALEEIGSCNIHRNSFSPVNVSNIANQSNKI